MSSRPDHHAESRRLASRASSASARALARAGKRTAVRAAGRNPWVLALVGLVAAATGGFTLLAVVLMLSLSPPADAATLERVLPNLSPVVLGAYLEASERAGELAPGCVVGPAVVAAIGAVESAHGTLGGATVDEATGVVSPPILGLRLDGEVAGTRVVRDTDGGALDGDPNYDRAVGPMQLLPSSWARFGSDGDGDGTADPHNVYDAAAATVVHLCQAPGPPTDLDADPAALWEAVLAYNRSEAYADRVLSLVAVYDLLLAPEGVLMAGADASALLASPQFSASARAVRDLEAGIIDPRLVDLLTVVAVRWPLHVSVLRTGHSQCVGGGDRQRRPDCHVSRHWYGRGADISEVAGLPVGPTNEAAREVVEWLAALPPDSGLRPSEVGSPWPDFSPLPGFFTDRDHQDHLHLAVCDPSLAGLAWGAPGC